MAECIVNLKVPGLDNTTTAIDWCLALDNVTPVDTTGWTLTPLGSDRGRYRVVVPLAPHGATFEIYEIANEANYNGGVLTNPVDDIAALQSSLSAVLSMGGVIAALVDIGAEISSALGPIVMEKGERKIIQVQVFEDAAHTTPKNCTGYTAQLGVKEKLTDTAFKLGPLAGVFSVDITGVLSILTFAIEPATTKSMTAFAGLYSAAIYDGSGNKTPLTERGGVAFTLREDILDVA